MIRDLDFFYLNDHYFLIYNYILTFEINKNKMQVLQTEVYVGTYQ